MLSLKKIIPISLILVMTISDVRASEKPISLPYPFKEKYSNPENDYQKYLKNTPMLPNPNVCQRLLAETISRKVESPSSAEVKWVTPPFLALGSFQILWSIMEAHITYLEFPPRPDKANKATFSCAVKYASRSSRNIWKQGHMEYHICWRRGHRKFMTCTINIVTDDKPGNPDLKIWLDDFRSL